MVFERRFSSPWVAWNCMVPMVFERRFSSPWVAWCPWCLRGGFLSVAWNCTVPIKVNVHCSALMADMTDRQNFKWTTTNTEGDYMDHLKTHYEEVTTPQINGGLELHGAHGV
jgi:hypothetical protein